MPQFLKPKVINSELKWNFSWGVGESVALQILPDSNSQPTWMMGIVVQWHLEGHKFLTPVLAFGPHHLTQLNGHINEPSPMWCPPDLMTTAQCWATMTKEGWMEVIGCLFLTKAVIQGPSPSLHSQFIINFIHTGWSAAFREELKAGRWKRKKRTGKDWGESWKNKPKSQGR